MAFKSNHGRYRDAVKYHACLHCRYHQKEKYDSCPECGSKDRQYFPSKAEFHRGMTLLLLRDGGKITNLKFQPRFDLHVNRKKIGTYVADASYYNHNGQYVVEDSKCGNYVDSLSKWKIKHFQIEYGMQINIPQSKKGTL